MTGSKSAASRFPRSRWSGSRDALANQPSGETGHASFQHPHRAAKRGGLLGPQIISGKTGTAVWSLEKDYSYDSPVTLSADGRRAAVMRSPNSDVSEHAIEVIDVMCEFSAQNAIVLRGKKGRIDSGIDFSAGEFRDFNNPTDLTINSC